MDDDAGNVRATAIAKLKRAASLPRMKDGRRPAIVTQAGEAASENERGRSHEPEDAAPAQTASTPTPPAETAPLPDNEPESSAVLSAADEPESDAQAQAAAPAKRHRARSRSRSRSKQRLKDGSRPASRQQLVSSPLLASPPRSPPLLTSDHDSPDEQPSSLPAFDHPPLMLASPVASPFPFLSPTTPFATSPRVASPLSPIASPALPSPALPSLETIQKHYVSGSLQRSASAAARSHALHKLTGGKVELDQIVEHAPLSPPVAEPTVALNRSNTVDSARVLDGSRVAVGRLMMRKLTERAKGIPEGETSGEEIVVPVSPKKRRRRSSQGRRRSAGPSIVDDREMSATPAPTTPSGALMLRPLPTGTPQLQDLDLYRGASPALSHNTQALERDRDSALARLIGEDHFEFDKHAGRARRGPVVEDDYNEDYAHNYGAPPRAPDTPSLALPPSTSRVPHSSVTPSFTTSSTTDSTADRVPLFIQDPSLPSPYKQDVFPKSPFGTPMKERRSSDVEFDMTQEYTNELSVPWSSSSRQNTPSWQTFPEPLYRRTSDDEESDEDVVSPTDVTQDPTEISLDHAPSASSTQDYGQIVLATSYREEDRGPVTEAETEDTLASRDVRASEVSTTSTLDAAPDALMLAPPQVEIRPDSFGADWEEIDPNTDITVRGPLGSRDAVPSSASSQPLSTWDKLKGVIGRSDGSASPQGHSRSASRAAGQRSGHVSQTSTDSMASSNSERIAPLEPGPGAGFWQQQQQQQPYQAPLQSSSTTNSTSMLSSLPSPSPFGGSSPIPLVTQADLAKYGADSKLQPFPVLAEMARQRGLSVSHSTPDVNIPVSGRQTPMSPLAGQFGGEPRPERGLLHQASDSKLLNRFYQSASPAPRQLKTVPSLEDVDRPMSPQTKSASTGKSSSKFRWMMKGRAASPGGDDPPPQRPGKQRKPSLADILNFSKKSDSSASHVNGNGNGNGVAHNPASSAQHHLPVMDLTAAGASRVGGAYHHIQEAGGFGPNERLPNRDMHNGRAQTRVASEDLETPSSSDVLPRTSQSDVILDSSADESAPPNSTADSFPTSPHSDAASQSDLDISPKPSFPMLRFNSLLKSGALRPADQTLRKLLFMSPVSQVVSTSSVKSRFLFLFNDILVLAQPAPEDESVPRPALDRRYEVRNVIELHRLRLCVGRDDAGSDYPTDGRGVVLREPAVQQFIRDFAINPSRAVDALQTKAGVGDDSVALGKLLFETVELDRGQLADYLSHRDRKRVLKAFIDCFGFAGVRIDTALRVFLLSLAMPTDGDPGAFEVLLGVFASRWFDVNSGSIAYGKEMTQQLVRSIISLNDALHPPQSLGHYARYAPPTPSITARNFIDACRNWDPTGQIGDDVLAGIYRSISMQQLQNAYNQAFRLNAGPPRLVKAEGLPSRLTYRVTSDPVHVRIAYPDPWFYIQLQGKDLLFDPPELRFEKSPEATFRVTGTSLGVKSIIMFRGGDHAAEYSGLPLSSNVTVERTYMRPVFQLAFLGSRGPRKYMFSVADQQLLQDWTSLLALHISTAADAQQHRSPSGADPLSRASEAIAMEALRACIGRSYTGHELVILAQQNSAIPGVLSILKGT